MITFHHPDPKDRDVLLANLQGPDNAPYRLKVFPRKYPRPRIIHRWSATLLDQDWNAVLKYNFFAPNAHKAAQIAVDFVTSELLQYAGIADALLPQLSTAPDAQEKGGPS